MSTPDFTSALAPLLSDQRLRDLFVRNADEATRQLGLVGADAAAFRVLPARQVNVQAQALITKRFREVQKLLPRTIARMGTAARTRFAEYASAYWPHGHRRHLEDAYQFGRYLLDKANDSLCRREWNRHSFLFTGARLQVHYWREPMNDPCRRVAAQVLWRRRRDDRARDAYLAFNVRQSTATNQKMPASRETAFGG